MRVLLIAFLTLGFTAHAGYTKEHIVESCINYKRNVVGRMIKEFQEESSGKSSQGLMLLKHYHTGAGRMMLEFGCLGLIRQLEEDHK